MGKNLEEIARAFAVEIWWSNLRNPSTEKLDIPNWDKLVRNGAVVEFEPHPDWKNISGFREKLRKIARESLQLEGKKPVGEYRLSILRDKKPAKIRIKFTKRPL